MRETGPGRAYQAGLVVVALFMLAGLIVAGAGLADFRHSGQPEADYDRSPNCTPNSPASSTMPPCQDETMTVASKSQYTSYRHTSWGQAYGARPYYSLSLRAPDGSVQNVGNIGESLWQSVAVGDPVSARVWRQQVTRVRANGHESWTYQHPAFTPLYCIMVIVGGGLLGMIGFGILRGMWAYRSA